MEATTTILAYTSEDGRYDAVRKAGVGLARERNATLILYDVDAAGVFGEEPMPTAFASEGEDELYPDRLEPRDLEALGRATIAQQVLEARGEGVDAYGWLTGSKSASRLAEYVESQGVDTVLVPAELEHPGLLGRIRSEGIDDIQKEVDSKIFVVDAQGQLAPV